MRVSLFWESFPSDCQFITLIFQIPKKTFINHLWSDCQPWHLGIWRNHLVLYSLTPCKHSPAASAGPWAAWLCWEWGGGLQCNIDCVTLSVYCAPAAADDNIKFSQCLQACCPLNCSLSMPWPLRFFHFFGVEDELCPFSPWNVNTWIIKNVMEYTEVVQLKTGNTVSAITLSQVKSVRYIVGWCYVMLGYVFMSLFLVVSCNIKSYLFFKLLLFQWHALEPTLRMLCVHMWLVGTFTNNSVCHYCHARNWQCAGWQSDMLSTRLLYCWIKSWQKSSLQRHLKIETLLSSSRTCVLAVIRNGC